MKSQSKFRLFSKRRIRIALGVLLVMFVAGVYFAFRPLPAGPRIEAAAAGPATQVNVVANAPEKVAVVDQPLTRSAAASVQKLDMGAGYVLETGPQGSRIIAPGAPFVTAGPTQKLDIGAGYMLETGPHGGRIIAPGAPFVTNGPTQKLDIGAGYVLELGPLGGRLVAPSAPFIAAPSVERMDIGAGYVLELGPLGGKIIAPNTLQVGPAQGSPAQYPKKIDLGGGYWLLIGPDGGKIVPPR